MKIMLYTIWDRVAEEAGPIICAKNDAVAVRNFRNYTKDVREDEYRLYRVGEYDNEKVMIFGLDGRPEEVVVAAVPMETEVN